MSEEKISIKKIAELTGYSVATVSRVINQNGRFSKETEKKIQKVIDEYGYSPQTVDKSHTRHHLYGIIAVKVVFSRVRRKRA
jgi:LacI family transcriptional regulator